MKLAEAFGRKEVTEYQGEAEDATLEKKVHDAVYDKVYEIAKAGSAKHERSEAFSNIKEESISLLRGRRNSEIGDLVKKYYYKAEKAAVRGSNTK